MNRLLDGHRRAPRRRSSPGSRRRSRRGLPPTSRSPVAARVKQAVAENVAQRVWRRDPSLWGGPGVPEIEDRLGWLTVSETMLEHAPRAATRSREECRADGFTDAVLLGMGGSSLGPEVIRRSFGEIPDGLRLQVLDSTHPDAIAAPSRSRSTSRRRCSSSPPSRAATIETLSHYRYFKAHGDARAVRRGHRPGQPARAARAQRTACGGRFLNPPDIGGRYSVLSYFGLVPAALMGVNIEALLHRCQVAEQNCAHYDSSRVELRAVARRRDRRARAARPRQADVHRLGADRELRAVGRAAGRRVDRQARPRDPAGRRRAARRPRRVRRLTACSSYLRNADEPDEKLDAAVEQLAAAGHPTMTLATARRRPTSGGSSSSPSSPSRSPAGRSRSTRSTSPTCRRPRTTPTGARVGLGARRSERGRRRSCGRCWATPARRTTSAILGYLPYVRTEFDAAVAELRAAIRAATGAATTFGYGPRFQHSTGQLHKGGAAERALPAARQRARGRRSRSRAAGYSFGTLIAAAGGRRPADAARARAAGRAGRARGRPGGRRCGR